jgi:hypothetical protein
LSPRLQCHAPGCPDPGRRGGTGIDPATDIRS